jgi:hypothetical protein
MQEREETVKEKIQDTVKLQYFTMEAITGDRNT